MTNDELLESNRKLKQALTRVSMENAELKHQMRPGRIYGATGIIGMSGYLPYRPMGSSSAYSGFVGSGFVMYGGGGGGGSSKNVMGGYVPSTSAAPQQYTSAASTASSITPKKSSWFKSVLSLF